jgi:glycosyltransferase involved in cell wall biosynthesis
MVGNLFHMLKMADRSGTGPWCARWGNTFNAFVATFRPDRKYRPILPRVPVYASLAPIKARRGGLEPVDMPTVSIVIPTLNASASIERCLYSIICQTFADYEVVIQDGGSVDDTIELVRRIQQANAGVQIKVHQEPDSGIYDAMNKAIHRASGEWLYFLGRDDKLHDGNVLSKVMNSPRLASCDVVYGNVQVVGNAPARRMAPVYDGIFDLEKLLKKNICHQAIFYRAKFLKQIGEYNTRYAMWADWDFNLRCWSKTDFKYMDTIVADFYTGGLTGTSSDECFTREVARNVLQYLGVSVYNPLVSNPEFVGFADIVKMQLRGAPWRLTRPVARHLVLCTCSKIVSCIRNYVWFPVLKSTRRVRHSMGLNRSNIRALLKRL